MDGTPPQNSFLDTSVHNAKYLWNFFEEEELENGNVGLTVYMDSWRSVPIAFIETSFPCSWEDFTDEVFLSIINDLREYVLGLPLAEANKREGAVWTDEDIERGYSEEANKIYVALTEDINSRWDVAKYQILRPERSAAEETSNKKEEDFENDELF